MNGDYDIQHKQLLTLIISLLGIRVFLDKTFNDQLMDGSSFAYLFTSLLHPHDN
jgi:hypothetical protein